ncbi:MAG: thiamine ABC transporter substrate-binding protein [Anaerolineales bacterium]|nr:thiamine ABC transporter substrate-binding protein [Anaerolineales bacterium]
MHSHAIEHQTRKHVGLGRCLPAVLGTSVLPLILLAGCAAPAAEPSPRETRTVTLMTHDSFAISETALQEFEAATGAKLAVLESGDAGAALNKAILTKQAPLADVFFGVDNTFLARALEEGVFETYASPRLDSIPAEYRLDPGNRALPVDYGDVCINYDRDWFAAHSLDVPGSLEDLAEEEYRGLLVVENPFTSSPGLAFLLATVAHFGPDGFADYWGSLKSNGTVVVDGWETAYYTNFSASSGKGFQPMVVSYATSPAFEFLYADPPRDEPPTASLLGPEMCFRQIEFAGILAGTEQRDLAEKLVEFLLSRTFQEDIPLQMAMFPVNPDAVLPEAFLRFAPLPAEPAVLAPEEIAAHREEWMNVWKGVMLS